VSSMNDDLDREMQELADMRMTWKRMDMVKQKKKADRIINLVTVLIVCLLIAAVAWAVGSH
jgi:hypothetical protein